jgi:hypothetical protein
MKVGGIAVIEGFLRFNSQYHHQKKKRKEKEKKDTNCQQSINITLEFVARPF